MSIDRIERDTLIAASVERVWSLVAVPGFWAADEDKQPTASAEEGQLLVAGNDEHGGYPIYVQKVDPPNYLAYRWTSAFPGEDLTEENSTLVEFTLTSEADQTRLRVVESGFASLPTSEENRSDTHADHTQGWEQCFDGLKNRAEQLAA